MKRKIFMGAGALLLASLGVMAGRASSNFATASSLFISSSSGCVQFSADNASTKFTTNVTGTGVQAAIRTSTAGILRKIYATSGCSTKLVYFAG